MNDKLIEAVARAIAAEYELDPDAESPKAAEHGHSIPEWLYFQPAARAAIRVIAPAVSEQARENERLREALQAKPWPPTDAELREMLAQIVGAWWSESSANNIRTAKNLKREDIKGVYAVRDALAPYVARAALKGTEG